MRGRRTKPTVDAYYSTVIAIVKIHRCHRGARWQQNLNKASAKSRLSKRQAVDASLR